uniref:Reverse transcriptase domain-containing protein n=1 Tax=Panagrellus redivivus TaxID=6233 RepID=A0A7E4W1C9_PANRE
MSRANASIPYPMGNNNTLKLLKSKLFATYYVGISHLFDTAHGSTLISISKKLNKKVTVCIRDMPAGIQGETPGMWAFEHKNLTDLIDIIVDDEAKLYYNVSTNPEGMDLDSFASQYTKNNDNAARKNAYIVMKMLCNLFKSMMDANIGLLPLKTKAIIVKATHDGEISELKIRRNFLCKECKWSDFKQHLHTVACMFSDLYDNPQKGDLLCQPELPFFQGLLPTSELTLEELMALPYLQVDPFLWTVEDYAMGPQPEAAPKADAEEEYDSAEDSDYEDEDAEGWSECDCEEDESCHCDSEDEEDVEEEEEEVDDFEDIDEHESRDDAVSVHTAIESSEDLNADEIISRRVDDMLCAKYFVGVKDEDLKIPDAAELQAIQDELAQLKRIVEAAVRSEEANDDEVRSVYAFDPLNEPIVDPISTTEVDDEVRSEYAFEYQEKAKDEDAKSVYAFDTLNIKDDNANEDTHSEYAFDLDLYEDVHSVYAFDINEDVDIPCTPSKEDAIAEDDEVRSEYAFEYQETMKVDPPKSSASYYSNDYNHNVYTSSWCQHDLAPYCPTNWF